MAPVRRNRTFLSGMPASGVDPGPTFVSSPADRWVYRGTVIRIARSSDSRQLIEQGLRLFQIGGVEALGKPAVDRRQQLARRGPPAPAELLRRRLQVWHAETMTM
jgi:hypothetical protein